MTAIPKNTNQYENNNELSVQFSPLLLTPNQIITRPIASIIQKKNVNTKPTNNSKIIYKIMQADNWKQRTEQLGKKTSKLTSLPHQTSLLLAS